jgi:hypothetical protein
VHDRDGHREREPRRNMSMAGVRRAFENLILAPIALSILSVGMETAGGLPGWLRQALRIEEIVVVAVFSLEYLLRIVAADKKLAFVFSFYGLVDLLAIAPFFLTGLDLRYLRTLRLLRVLRVLKLQRRILENTVAKRTRELAERHAALEQAQAQLNAELDVARALQIAILPSTFPRRPASPGPGTAATNGWSRSRSCDRPPPAMLTSGAAAAPQR